MSKNSQGAIDVGTFGMAALPHLERQLSENRAVMGELAAQVVKDVQAGRSLFVFGSGHSGIFPLELYHRAGGASFVIPIVADYLLPCAGPPVVRLLERSAGAAKVLLNRYDPRKGEMIWLCSQSGINVAIVDLALECRERGLRTVAFTSRVHSTGVPARHPSGKRLFEVCDHVVDLGGFVGDASVELGAGVRAGPVSTLGAILLGHSILVAACAELEGAGRRCVYTSVNTPEGETRNVGLEEEASKRDFLLR